jgi:hypothetical protein
MHAVNSLSAHIQQYVDHQVSASIGQIASNVGSQVSSNADLNEFSNFQEMSRYFSLEMQFAGLFV